MDKRRSVLKTSHHLWFRSKNIRTEKNSDRGDGDGTPQRDSSFLRQKAASSMHGIKACK